MRRTTGISFGDLPATEILRPVGHTKIELAVRWVTKQSDGLYLQSRYGVLRLSPINSGIIRVTFSKGSQILEGVHSQIAVQKTDRAWMYKDTSKTVELLTDELCLSVDKVTGAIRYMTRDKKLLLAERSRECRQIEVSPAGKTRSWLFLDLQKNENIYGLGAKGTDGLKLRGTARYISDGNGSQVISSHGNSSVGNASRQNASHWTNSSQLPFLLSDKGYGIVIASDGPTLCCDIPAYGSYLYTEKSVQQDYYFIAGKKPGTILSAYAYLTGRL